MNPNDDKTPMTVPNPQRPEHNPSKFYYDKYERVEALAKDILTAIKGDGVFTATDERELATLIGIADAIRGLRDYALRNNEVGLARRLRFDVEAMEEVIRGI